MKIISFPFAGGNKYCYPGLSKDIEGFHVIEYSGRGLRFNEPLGTNLNDIAAEMAEYTQRLVKEDEDFILYGHSMGAVIAFLVAQILQEQQFKKPAKLVVSGRMSPSIKPGRFISHLPDDEFWQQIISLGGIHHELQDNPELIEMILPVLRADIIALENCQFNLKSTLSIPIDAFHGSMEDITEQEMMAWKDVTDKELNVYKLTGDHFFIYDHLNYFTSYFISLQIQTRSHND